VGVSSSAKEAVLVAGRAAEAPFSARQLKSDEAVSFNDNPWTRPTTHSSGTASCTRRPRSTTTARLCRAQPFDNLARGFAEHPDTWEPPVTQVRS